MTGNIYLPAVDDREDISRLTIGNEELYHFGRWLTASQWSICVRRLCNSPEP